jgi:hypothetical protein
MIGTEDAYGNIFSFEAASWLIVGILLYFNLHEWDQKIADLLPSLSVKHERWFR